MVTSASALVVRALRKYYGDVKAVDGLELDGELAIITAWLVISFVAALKLFRWW